MVPRVPAPKAHQRLQEFSFASSKRLWQQYRSKGDITQPHTHVCFTPRKQTLVRVVGRSAKCQNRTHATQQIESLFDHLIGAGE